MNSSLRSAIRAIAQQSSPASGAAKKLDAEQAQRILRALGVIWAALKKAWPRFTAWFRKGLTDDEWDRVVQLGNKLPSVTAEERDELLMLVRRGLRLERRSAEEI